MVNEQHILERSEQMCPPWDLYFSPRHLLLLTHRAILLRILQGLGRLLGLMLQASMLGPAGSLFRTRPLLPAILSNLWPWCFCLLPRHLILQGVPEFDSQYPCKIQAWQGVPAISALGGGDRRIPQAGWPAHLVELVSSRVRTFRK